LHIFFRFSDDLEGYVIILNKEELDKSKDKTNKWLDTEFKVSLFCDYHFIVALGKEGKKFDYLKHRFYHGLA
jgi:hypothetical protein